MHLRSPCTSRAGCEGLSRRHRQHCTGDEGCDQNCSGYSTRLHRRDDLPVLGSNTAKFDHGCISPAALHLL
jgi:hypothetical protein